MEDAQLVDSIRSTPAEHDKAIAHLFTDSRYRGVIFAMLIKKGLSSDEANQLWTDIVVKFGLLVRNGKYQEQGRLLGYLKNLGNYMLLNFLRDKGRVVMSDISTVDNQLILSCTQDHCELKLLFAQQLDLLGEICKKILGMWSRGYSMNDIMIACSIISPEATRKRKHICLKKLSTHIHEQPRLKSLFESYLS